MSRRRIAAYTKEDIAPSYISINEDKDGFISVTVRSDRQADGSTGNLASIRLPKNIAERLFADAYLGAYAG